MVRTVDSPRCWATSSTRRLLPFLVSIALRMAGKWPSNCTSTTAPMTCVIRPVWLAGLAMKTLSSNPESNNRQLDGDVALGRFGIGADRVSFLRCRLELGLVGAGNRNLQFGRQVEAALGIQRDFAGHLGGLGIDAVLFRDQHQG